MKNSAFKKLTFSQKVSLLILLLLVIALPIAALASFNPIKLFKHAAGEPTCKTGVNTFGVDTPCGEGNYRYMTFACYDGFGRREGSPTSCKSSETWNSYAQGYCVGHSSCSVPTPTPTATIPNTNSITTDVSCVESDKVISYPHVDVSFKAVVYSYTKNGLWMTFTDERTGKSTIHSYWNSSPSNSGTIHGTVIPIRNQEGIPIIGDGRKYSIKVYDAPYTTGMPTLSNLIIQKVFSANCVTPTVTPPPVYAPTFSTSSLPEGNVANYYKATIQGKQNHVMSNSGLTMTVTGLPKGMRSICTTNTTSSNMLKTTYATCTITGTPSLSTVGSHTLKATLKDSVGSVVSKSFPLKINGRTTE